MIFKTISIQNFGLFCGSHEFDLEPRTKYRKTNPIILFGGKNGAGKTTFLEAIQLCLYGKSALNSRMSNQDYGKYIAGRIHRPRGGGGVKLKNASIQLAFSYAKFGEQYLYTVKRAWKKSDSMKDEIEEQLTLEENGEELFETEQVQEFLNDLVPIGVSQLFFFDGEKIQNLAEEEGGTILAESVKSMLSLDIIEQLKYDLTIYSNRKKKKAQDRKTEKHLKNIEKRKFDFETELSDLRQDRAQIEAHLQRVTAKIEEAETEFAAAGGKYAERREEFKSHYASLDTQIEQCKGRIREECSRLFPFSLVPELCEQLTQQVQGENEVQKWHIVKDVAQTRWKDIKENLNNGIAKHPIADNENLIDQIGSMIIEAFQPPEDFEAIKILHNFSQDEGSQLINWAKSGAPASRDIVIDMTRQLEKALTELEKVETNLQRIPDDDAIAPHIKKMNDLNQTLGSLNTKSERIEREIRQHEHRLNETTREYQKVLDELSLEEDLDHRLKLINGVQGVLGEYFDQLAQTKVRKLEHAVAQCFDLLCRKSDMIRRIEIDPQKFSVTLYDRQGQAIPKKQLSAGEKQIYAISMLWALAQTSGRPLPVIIDTPLGRLDSDHRRNLIECYFSQASHQVIILSTDTEIDQKYIKALNPFISHAYHLQYNPETESSTASEGYFWKHRESDYETQQDQALLGSLQPA